MKVLKFGGTSVGNAENIKRVAEICANSERSIVVLSAMAGTTNKLVVVADLLKINNLELAGDKLDKLAMEYKKVAKELLTNDLTINNFEKLLAEMLLKIKGLLRYNYNELIKNQIIAMGEMITSQLFSCYLTDIGIAHKLIWADNFIRIDEERDPIYPAIKSRLQGLITNDVDLYITQGFICRNSMNQIDTFTRGGSDYTTTIIGSVIDAEEVQIWTDIDGMHNNDPRYVSETRSITHLTYDEAQELAFFGAKILHPMCIEPVKRRSIPVLIKNTMNPKANGTFISNISNKTGVKAIAAKDNIVSIKIISAKMMQAHGFLKKIFEVFDQYKTSVDMVTTSEVTVSVTLENAEYLNEIVEDLNKIGNVEVSKEQTLICIVGDLKGKGINQIMQATRNIPVEMISYGSNSTNIVLLIKSNYKTQVLQELNQELFKENNVYTRNNSQVLSN